MSKKTDRDGHLNNARVYLSGPMDFVASRSEERQSGWRVRVGEFLRSFGATVFDPWFKPKVRGFHEYGREDVATVQLREEWVFDPTSQGAQTRARCAHAFWETMHVAPHGGHKRLCDRLLPNKYLQCGHTTRDHHSKAAAQACPFRKYAGEVPSTRWASQALV